MEFEHIVEHYRSCRLLYHGTTRSFFKEKIETCGRYQQNGKSLIHLDDSLLSTSGFAFCRAEFYNDVGVLVIINNAVVFPRLLWKGVSGNPQIKYLNPSEITTFDFGKRDEKRVTEKDLEAVIRIVKESFGFDISPIK